MTSTSDAHFIDRARAIFTRLGAGPEVAGDLVAWAQATRAGDDPTSRGVLIAFDGRVLAETRFSDTRGGWYVTSCSDHRVDVVDVVLSQARSRLRRHTASCVLHYSYRDLCHTPGERININLDRVDVDGNPIICSDGRPEYQYAALRAYAGDVPLRWLPAGPIDDDTLEVAFAAANAVASRYGKEIVWAEDASLIEVDILEPGRLTS